MSRLSVRVTSAGHCSDAYYACLSNVNPGCARRLGQSWQCGQSELQTKLEDGRNSRTPPTVRLLLSDARCL